MNILVPLGLGLGIRLDDRRRLLDDHVIKMIDGGSLMQNEALKDSPDRGCRDRRVGGDEAGEGADAQPGARIQAKVGSPLVIQADREHRSPATHRQHPQDKTEMALKMPAGTATIRVAKVASFQEIPCAWTRGCGRRRLSPVRSASVCTSAGPSSGASNLTWGDPHVGQKSVDSFRLAPQRWQSTFTLLKLSQPKRSANTNRKEERLPVLGQPFSFLRIA